jgi:hypothetical protein
MGDIGLNAQGIALAQWALISEFRQGRLTTLDLPRVVREDFGLNAVEFVNTLFESSRIRPWRADASDHGG